MFSPTQADVRGFFVDARSKRLARLPLTPLQTIAADWIEAHPEYEPDLVAADTAAEPDAPQEGRENPFLHLSMHLSISEQLAIDQPAGIRQAFEQLARRLGSQHAACLGARVVKLARLTDDDRAGSDDEDGIDV